jgi:hypothetical protein
MPFDHYVLDLDGEECIYCLKQGDAPSPLLFNFTLEYDIRKVKEIKVKLKLNGTHLLLAYADDVNLLGITSML